MALLSRQQTTDRHGIWTPPTEDEKDLQPHNPVTKPAILVSSVPDTPSSLSPDLTQEGGMSFSRDFSHPRLGASPHAEVLGRQCARVTELLAVGGGGCQSVHVDHLCPITVADVVAVSKHGVCVDLQDQGAARKRLSACVDALRQRIDKGDSLYGINTGFGGSANVRTTKLLNLQRALLQHQQSGILPTVKELGSKQAKIRSSPSMNFMPEQWVRGAMLVRCKSLLHGYSAIRWELIETMITLLNANLIPLVPLRGSISASGDLQPTSYIAGVIEGNPDIWVWTDSAEGERVLIPSHLALAKVNLQPQIFGPKEGLAILNGTAFSTSVAALAIHEANQLAILSQVLTAMGVEALSGDIASFDPFFAKVRPHEGQVEAARNILSFLEGSSLARHDTVAEDNDLKQDRYSIRTASQWIGPQLEDLALAHEQISVECNSTTDNPLLDVEDHKVHHGGNFQAASVTSAMEKTRLSLQMLGRMLFSQFTELINPSTNQGLPPNLAADEPSSSFTFKGIDINVAAYMSELAYLANPVSSHVQTAEMGNQAINSLALVSARYTHQAIETLSMICASYIYTLCQALDLRVMNHRFMEDVLTEVYQLTFEAFEYVLKKDLDKDNLQALLVQHIKKKMAKTTELDSTDRFQYIVDSAQAVIISFFTKIDAGKLNEPFDILDLVKQWNCRCSARLLLMFSANRKKYFEDSDARPYLGKASAKMYTYVRNDLGIPFHRGLADCPSTTNGLRTVGSNVSIIYEALRNGKLYDTMMELVKDADPKDNALKRETKISAPIPSEPTADVGADSLAGI